MNFVRGQFEKKDTVTQTLFGDTPASARDGRVMEHRSTEELAGTDSLVAHVDFPTVTDVELSQGTQRKQEGILGAFLNKAMEKDLAEPPECMVCWSAPPIFVFAACGHQGLCKKCRKYMMIKSYIEGRVKPMHPGDVSMKLAKKVTVLCPVCRSRSKIPHVSEFKGPTYAV
jgi:hypothetical protein